MQDRSWRRRWAILATMLIVPVVLAAVFAASFEKPRSAEPFACPEPLTGIDAELKVHLEKKGLVAPQATVSMLVEVPNDNGIAWDLLRRVREDEHHKLALRCVLGEPVFYWNQAAPTVTKQGDRVAVKVEATAPVSLFSGEYTQIGALLIHSTGTERWTATIGAPPFLALARWREVSVTAPAGWLSGSQPYLTPVLEAQRILWMPPALQTPMDGGSLASFSIHPDVRTQIAATSQTPHWRWIHYALFALNTVVLVGLLVLWAHRNRVAWVPRMCLPIIAVALLVTAHRVADGYLWRIWPWNILIAPAVIAAVAAAWGIPRLIGVAVVLEAWLVAWIVYLKPESPLPDTEGVLALAAQTAVAFQLALLLLAGLINAARMLLSDAQSIPPPSLRPPLWVWFIGAVFAAVLVVEQFVSVKATFARPWADSEVLSPGLAAWGMVWHPVNTIYAIDNVLPILGVIGVWALIRHRIEQRFVILLFVMGPVTWIAEPFGLWVPTWPLAWLVLWLWLRRTPLLEMPLSPQGPTVRSIIEEHDFNQIRVAAARWSRIRHRGLALDRDLAKGAIKIDVHAEETKKLASSPLLPVANVQTFDRLRAASVTPVDVVLALGPRETPLENAKQGAIMAALVGTPAAALRLWLWWREYPESTYPSLLEWTSVVAWEAAVWLAAGAVLGLLWQQLPFRRGLGRAVPLVTAFAAVELVRYAAVELTGGDSHALVDAALFTAVITITALLMDMEALRPADTWWSRKRDAFAAAYGMENLATQVAFVAAQTVAIITIITFISGGIGRQPTETKPPPAVQQTR